MVTINQTNIDIDDQPVLYIQYVNDGSMPSNIMQEEMCRVQKLFAENLPNVNVLVGYAELKFTFINAKQLFVETLAGTFNKLEEDK